MPNKLPENPTWDDYKKDYEEWRIGILKETLDQFKDALAKDDQVRSLLEKEIERKQKHIELIEAELAKR